MSQPIPCEYIPWPRFYGLCRRLVAKIRAADFRPQVIVAIGRGGWMPARILSDFLGQMNLASIRIEHYRGAHRSRLAIVRHPLNADVNGQRVLVVDDVSDSGDTFAVALDHVRACGTPAEMRTAALHHKAVSRFVPDFYAHEVREWRWITYPWAAIEDLSTFLEAMEPRPATPEAFAARLARDHHLRVPRALLMDVLAAAGRRTWTADQ